MPCAASFAVLAVTAAALAGCGGGDEYAGLSRGGASWGAQHALIRQHVPVGTSVAVTKSKSPSGQRAWLAVARRHGRSTCVWVWANDEKTFWYTLQGCSA